jgi:hypothetical protein
VVPPKLYSRIRLKRDAVPLYGDNGPTRGPILSHSCDSDRTPAIPIALLRFEGPTPGWFSRPSGQGGSQPVTPSLLDLSQTVLVPVSDFIRSVVAVPSAAQPVLQFARLYHLTAVSQGTTVRGFQVSGFKVSGCGAVMPAATIR